jgi:hypothetical protein
MALIASRSAGFISPPFEQVQFQYAAAATVGQEVSEHVQKVALLAVLLFNLPYLDLRPIRLYPHL